MFWLVVLYVMGSGTFSCSGWYFMLRWLVPYVLMGCFLMLLRAVPYVLATGIICYSGCYLMFGG